MVDKESHLLLFWRTDLPYGKSENIIEINDVTEALPIEQPMDSPEQECTPSQQSNQDSGNPDCPEDSHLAKYDVILEKLKKREIEKQAEIMNAIREYITIKTAPYLAKEAIAILISNIEYMACDQPNLYKPIRSNIDNPLRSPGLRHLAWNVGERLGYHWQKEPFLSRLHFHTNLKRRLLNISDLIYGIMFQARFRLMYPIRAIIVSI